MLCGLTKYNLYKLFVIVQIWCAAGVDLSGGRTKDGGSAIGASSVFYTESARDQEEGEKDLQHDPKVSMVWIGSSTHSCSKVTVVDANYPQNILDCFIVCTSHLLCITPVPSASEGDYQSSEWTVEGIYWPCLYLPVTPFIRTPHYNNYEGLISPHWSLIQGSH